MARRSRTPVARHGRLPRQSAWKTVLTFIGAAAVVAVVSGSAIVAWAVTDVTASASESVDFVNESGETEDVPDFSSIEGGANILIVGSDSREGQGDGYGDPTKETGNLNDVTMLVHIAEDHSNVSVVSFPRDMYVSIPSCPKDDDSGGYYSAMSSQKINTALGYGGLNCVKLTVENLTGLEIQYAAMVQFNGVVALSEALGGVTVCLASPIQDSYTDLDLPAGEVSLQGLEALQFLRTRHGVSDQSDLGRISNQQLFLSAVVRELKSAGTLSDPVTLYSIAKVAAANMTLSTSLNNVNTMVSIAMAMADVPTDKFTFVQYPNYLSGDGVYPITADAQVLMDAIAADQSLTVTGGTGGSIAEDGTSTDAGDDGTGDDSTGDGTDDTTATKEPTDTSTDDSGNVDLPDSIKGQSADEVTCADGNS